MRILIAHEAVHSSGGVERYLECVVPGLVARGHGVAALYYRRRNGADRGWTADAQVSIGAEETGWTHAISQVRHWRPDVCFSHNMAPLAVDRSLAAEWPVVKMMHGYFGTCASGLKTHAWPAAEACHRTFGSACIAHYFPRRCGQLRPRALLDGYRWARTQQSLFSCYSSIVVASAHMHGEYERHGVPRSRLDVLPLFPTIASPARAVEGRDDGSTVLFAGRMTTLKGGHLLIRAASVAGNRLGRPIRLILSGDGPQRHEWTHQADALGVHAEFTGWVTGEARAGVFGRASVLVVPSLWPEPFGIVGLDAAAFGVPAIAFDTGGISGWLTPGRNGLLVPPAEGSEGLADAIVSILSNRTERGRLAAGARAVAAEMSLGRHLAGLEQLLGVRSRFSDRDPRPGKGQKSRSDPVIPRDPRDRGLTP